ncbi:unnamed protein product [Rotaria sp. Silwood1]|nr:unnamed protein product [Rotaria sp. Silwood1]
MCDHFDWDNNGKKLTISLRNCSHETCVALTQPTYWQELTKDTSISISTNGKFVPKELEEIIDYDNPSRLQLIIQTEHEKDKQRLQDISWIIYHRFFAYPCEEPKQWEEDNSNIIDIENRLGISITIDQTLPNFYRFLTRNIDKTIINVFILLIETLVKKAQNEYLIAFTFRYAPPIVRSVIQVKDLNQRARLPYTESYQRKRDEQDEKQSITNNTKRSKADSNQNTKDEITPEEKICQTGHSDLHIS